MLFFWGNTSRFRRLVADWLVEHLTPDVTLNRMSLDISILIFFKYPNKHQISIRSSQVQTRFTVQPFYQIVKSYVFIFDPVLQSCMKIKTKHTHELNYSLDNDISLSYHVT
jgi:hypothetical protein